MAAGKNEGEGNQTAAKAYNEATQKHVREHDVAREAKEAERALTGAEGAELREAEKAGRARAKGEDPQVKR